MTRTFVDAGVLIAAATGRQPALYQRAIAVLDDPVRDFVASDFLRLEVLPKAIYTRRRDEVAFYERFFQGISAWASPLNRVAEAALREAMQSGLGAMDALHIAAAVLLGADELVTTERITAPIHRTTAITVVSIHPSAVSTP